MKLFTALQADEYTAAAAVGHHMLRVEESPEMSGFDSTQVCT
jgi:hypothetical protein